MNSQRASQAQVPVPPDRPYVLLVEDNVEDEALAQRILKKYHIANSVLWAKDGEGAYKLLKERLSPVSAAGRSPATETTQVFARNRYAESSAGATLLPVPEAEGRPQGPEAARPGEAKTTHGSAVSNGGSNGSNGSGGMGGNNGTHPLNRPPELFILSYSQPRTPVMDMVRRLRTLPGMESVPMILCCRTPEEEKVVRDSGLHRVSALSKPIGFFKLLECIQRMDMHWIVLAERP